MKRKFRMASLAAAIVLSLILSIVSAAATGDTAENGLWAEYYRGNTFGEYVLSRVDSNIDFSWHDGTGPVDGLSEEHFSVRWSGRLRADVTGRYTIYTAADDGIKLSLDGKVIINDAGPHTTAENSASVELTAGQYYDLVAEYYNGELGGDIKLMWQAPGGNKQVIGAENLFLPDKAAAVGFVKNGLSITAESRMLCDSADSLTLVTEVYTESGELIAKYEKQRNGLQPRWESDSMDYTEGNTYKAYVADGDGNTVSGVAEETYGVDSVLDIDTKNSTGTITNLMYGACIEDVNHELYGGIWSQMIFGESFAEAAKVKSDVFTVAGGTWSTEPDGEANRLCIEQESDGPKIVINNTSDIVDASADVYITGGGPAGFIIKTTDPKPGSDSFNGYEIGLSNNSLRIGKHQYNYTFISDTPCSAPEGQWNTLRVKIDGATLSVYVNGSLVTSYTDPSPLADGDVGFRAWNCGAKFKNIKLTDKSGDLEEFVIPDLADDESVSDMWEAVERGTAAGEFEIMTENPYKGKQSQRVRFVSGNGAVGINNMSLNRKGMNFVSGNPYEGYFYAKSDRELTVQAVFESADGSVQYAKQDITVSGDEWKKYEFALTPDVSDSAGRFTLQLVGEGVADFGYVFLQPGEWGRYEGLQVRKDVAELLIKQNVTVLRMGGCMANAAEYKWKDMLGAPEERPVYKGWWYAQSSFGFGIVEFLDMCEKMGIVGVPDFNGYESAQDMADFADFALGTDPENKWTALRISMGHPEPYNLPYIQYGNEERVDVNFASRFNAAAKAVWAKYPDVSMVVGDFEYRDVITDPSNITGTASGITNLDGQISILNCAAENGGRVLFDIHIWNDRASQIPPRVDAALSMHKVLSEACPNADFDFVCFEFNSTFHNFERALANAYGINRLERTGIFEIICSANCLQVDGHNDNGWDQGLIFMNNDSAWMQPPAYITKMAASNYQPLVLESGLSKELKDLDFTVLGSEDGKTVVIKAVNYGNNQYTVEALLNNFDADSTVGFVECYQGSISESNTAENPENIVPAETVMLKDPVKNGGMAYTFSPYSYTVITITAHESVIDDYKLGDVDKNGEINVSDMMMLKSLIMNGRWTDEQLRLGDVNKSGALDVGDIISVKSIIMGQN